MIKIKKIQEDQSLEIDKKLFLVVGDIKFYWINGEWARKYVSIEFTIGGHYYRYEQIPDNEIWMERNNKSQTDFKADCIHELTEFLVQKYKGLEYDDAHENWANTIETFIRQDLILEQKVNQYTKMLKEKFNFKLHENKYDTIAFWMKGREVFETSIHIDAIIKEPYKFDITMEEIKSIYDRHNERIGQEGKAREEIIKSIANNGWIKIRHYVRPKDYWSIQFDQYYKRKKQIEYFIDWALKKNIMKSDDAIALVGYDDHFVQNYSTSEGGVSKIFWEHKLRNNNCDKNK